MAPMVHLSAMYGLRHLSMHQRLSAVICKTCPYHLPSPNGKAAYPAGIVPRKRAGECFTMIVESIACRNPRQRANHSSSEHYRRIP